MSHPPTPPFRPDTDPWSTLRKTHYRTLFERPSEAPQRALPRQRAFTLRELLSVLSLIVLGDLGFYVYGGAAQALCLLLSAAVLVCVRPIPRTSPRLLAILGLGFALALRCLYLPSGWVSLMGILMLAAIAQATRMRALHVIEYGVALTSVPFKLGRRIHAFARGLAAYGVLRQRGSALSIAIPIAIVSAFASVFCLANPVLERLILGALHWLQNHFPSLERMALWSAVSIAALTLVRPALRMPLAWQERANPDDADAEADAEASDSRPMEQAIARNALIGLNALFLLQNLLDAPQMLAFQAPAGMTTRQYAHAGALWLTVALLMLNATIGFFFRSRLAVAPHARNVRRLAYGLVAQGFVLSACTYERMLLHVHTVGLSNLHIVGFIGATMVVVGMVAIAYKLARAKTFAFLLRRQLEVAVAALVVFAVLPTHALSARFNVARIQAGELHPVIHLFAQAKSAESAALLLPLCGHPNAVVRNGIRALLASEARVVQARARWAREHGILTWNYADAHAASSFAEALGAPEVDAGRADAIDALAELAREQDDAFVLP
jgi:Domain of unknown function (DUF4173)